MEKQVFIEKIMENKEVLERFMGYRAGEAPAEGFSKEAVEEHYDFLPDDVLQWYSKRELNGLQEQDIQIGDELVVESEGKCINACLGTWFDVDEYFGTDTREKEDTWVNLYADYYPSTKEVKGTYVVNASDHVEEFPWEFTKAEQDLIRAKMDAYCKEQDGKTLDELYEEITEEPLMKFYVHNNLRGSQDNVKMEVFRFDNLADAIAKYKELPKEWTTALGGSIGGVSALDFVQRINGNSAIVQDYQKIPRFGERGDMMNILNVLKEELAIQFRLVQDIHPWVSVLDRVHELDAVTGSAKEEKPLSAYYDGKVLYSSSRALNSAIREVCVEEKGWMDPKEFATLCKDGYSDSYRPIVQLINVAYIEPDTGYVGQADISAGDFVKLKEKTAAFLKEREEKSLDVRLSEAKKKSSVFEKENREIGKEPVR